MIGIARLLAALAVSRRARVDGVTAVDWRNSVFTRHRTDLPFPPARPSRPTRARW